MNIEHGTESDDDDETLLMGFPCWIFSVYTYHWDKYHGKSRSLDNLCFYCSRRSLLRGLRNFLKDDCNRHLQEGFTLSKFDLDEISNELIVKTPSGKKFKFDDFIYEEENPKLSDFKDHPGFPNEYTIQSVIDYFTEDPDLLDGTIIQTDCSKAETEIYAKIESCSDTLEFTDKCKDLANQS